MNIEKSLRERLTNSVVKTDEPLQRYTYSHTGGNADYYISVYNIHDAMETIRFAKEYSIPITYLGNGSNLIIRDGGIRGIVLNTLELKEIKRDGDYITSGSGSRIIDVSRFARDHSLTGLEFACGIPGSVGGAVYMNAGAYGGELKDCLVEASVITPDGELLTLTNEELHLGYRQSIVQENGYLVVEATFKLEEGNLSEINAKMDELTFLRESKQPLDLPSCGSVFQRPPGHFAGKLIQDSGLQGHRIGGVEVSKKHAGFMVNIDNGTGSDYEELIHHVQEVVKEKYDVLLQREVRIIGEHKEKTIQD
ncbi:UDP-N-acetylmuramate dehydrogenase [Nosocomiicoccus massiliensis]|uniref:UDP-N-acetylmuramate dehydrogenase n=1 Tax=Nosocomiicoccus massiliensis TaxID=1232430 RepID=UPI0003FE9F7F|nr:UDP-N-acetylmuramate dehydrogenase [Nosocomiicoccus massiliensis]